MLVNIAAQILYLALCPPQFVFNLEVLLANNFLVNSSAVDATIPQLRQAEAAALLDLRSENAQPFSFNAFFQNLPYFAHFLVCIVHYPLVLFIGPFRIDVLKVLMPIGSFEAHSQLGNHVRFLRDVPPLLGYLDFVVRARVLQANSILKLAAQMLDVCLRLRNLSLGKPDFSLQVRCLRFLQICGRIILLQRKIARANRRFYFSISVRHESVPEI